MLVIVDLEFENLFRIGTEYISPCPEFIPSRGVFADLLEAIIKLRLKLIHCIVFSDAWSGSEWVSRMTRWALRALWPLRSTGSLDR